MVTCKKTAPTKRLGASIGKYVPNLSRILQRRLDGLLPFVERRPLGISMFFMVIFVLCAFGASKVHVSFNMMENYEETSPLRLAYKLVDDHMMGTQNMEIFLDLENEYAFQDPMVLTEIDKLQQTIEKKYGDFVLRTSSLADVVKDANQKLNEGKEDMYALPASREAISQTLFMFNNANPENRRRVVSDDYSKSHITVNLRNTDAASYHNLFDRMQSDIDKTVAVLKESYPDTRLTLTGTLAMMMKASTFVSQSTSGSLTLAVLAITIMLLLVFGSFKAGLIAIVPNLIPSILTYSILGWFKIPLDMNTLLIGPIIIGIAADDTIHFITHYRTEVVIDGNVRRALQAAIKEAGQAVVFSTLVLGLGFGILGFATGPVANTGKLGALAILAGLLCELLLLPAMILLFKPTFQWKKRQMPLNRRWQYEKQDSHKGNSHSNGPGGNAQPVGTVGPRNHGTLR
ncbi:MAG: MMPL family transporter [Bacteroidales bacterium]|nr:MMPL family transporter [Bacteroidales bacterium]